MSVKVLFFGKLKDITGSSELKIESSSVFELKDELFKKFSELKNEFFIIAVNQNIIQDNQDIPLKENDEVALLPPVSGG